jgi:hypothetical protein
MLVRSAVRTVPACGVSAIAQPTMTRVASSTNIVTHGLVAGPRGGKTRIGRFLWSPSHTWLRYDARRRR